MVTFWERFGYIVDRYQQRYWNNYWRKTNILYTARPGWNQNISEILNMVPIEEAVKIENYFKGYHLKEFAKSDHRKAVFALRWCINNFRYIGDYKKLKKYEFWQYAHETYKDRTGDCEDGAVFMYHILRLMGVPAWKLRLVAQDVQYKGSVVGHCFLSMLVRGNGRWSYDWYVLDWCYYPRASLMNFKNQTVRETQMYNPSSRPIWWSFNEEYEWAQKSWSTPFRRLTGPIQDIIL